MLQRLFIKNYALIQNLEIEPSANLNVVTGETGAGKSIMLGALGLLLGNRADSKVLLNEEDKCITEGTFNIADYKLKKLFLQFDLDYSDITVLRREISPGGKSRAFINDTPVTLDVMKAIGARLMDIHSQHETLELGKKYFQLELIDIYSKNEKLRNEYAALWIDFKSKEEKYQELVANAQKIRQESDYIQFQLKELNALSLKSDELATLEENVKLGENSEEIKSKLSQIVKILRDAEQSGLSSLTEARAILNSIVTYSNDYQKLFQRLESIRLELDDISNDMERAGEEIEFNPEHIKNLKDRLDAIYRLMKKHGVNSIQDLLVIQDKLSEQASTAQNLDEAIAQAKKEFESSFKKVKESGKQLSDARKKSFQPISKQLVKLLQELGIPQAAVEVSHQITEPSANGIDDIEINFSANKGVVPRPLAEVASGGEFSRLMFSIKYIMAEKTALPTLILDEIDSGVSGEIAISLGKLMKQMAVSHQIISISHLPQIAAKADTHYVVFKDDRAKKSISQIRKLDSSARVEEIAKMIAGAKPTAIAMENARELIGS